MKKFVKEFREFIASGNVIEFAVAVIMAAAIGAVIKDFVSKIMMPFVSHFTGGVSFKEWKIVLDEAVKDPEGKIIKPENAILYGEWLDTIVYLIIVGFILFLMIKAYNNFKKKEEPAPEEPKGPTTEELLAEIRDLLKEKN